jgi:hypothetical protein
MGRTDWVKGNYRQYRATPPKSGFINKPGKRRNLQRVAWYVSRYAKLYGMDCGKPKSCKCFLVKA